MVCGRSEKTGKTFIRSRKAPFSFEKLKFLIKSSNKVWEQKNIYKIIVDKLILLCYNIIEVKGGDKILNRNKKPNINKGEKLWKENLFNLKISRD